MSTSESDGEEPNQESLRKRTSLVALLDDSEGMPLVNLDKFILYATSSVILICHVVTVGSNSRKKNAQKLATSMSGSASQLARAQESFSSVFARPLPVKKQQSTSCNTHVDKAGVKALGVKKKKRIKTMSLSQQEEEFCNSQNLSQLLDNEQLWASDHSDS